jgi:hypothetical protein
MKIRDPMSLRHPVFDLSRGSSELSCLVYMCLIKTIQISHKTCQNGILFLPKNRGKKGCICTYIYMYVYLFTHIH